MRSTAAILALSVALGFAGPGRAVAAPQPHAIAAPLCTSLVASVRGAGRGSAPRFVRSYQPGPGELDLPAPLRTSAFAYDNALVVIALAACGKADEASPVGKAFQAALNRDRTFKDGRIRNAYRAGMVPDGPVLLPGWWDAGAKLWAEDSYQDGSATGNLAWVALAMLTLHESTGDKSYLADARRLMDWIAARTKGGPGPKGFTGGLHGYDGGQIPLTWKSTEHNLDIHAVATWLHRITGEPSYASMAQDGRAFLDSMFIKESGYFRIGTLPDGRLADPRTLVLDAQLWPLLGVARPPAVWRGAVAFARQKLAVRGGFDFNGDRDGVWVEGTAQAALTYLAVGDQAGARALLDSLTGDIAPAGGLYATREPKITTGLAIGPDSAAADFFYFRRPHLAATAWAVLAAQRWNPFTGKRLD